MEQEHLDVGNRLAEYVDFLIQQGKKPFYAKKVVGIKAVPGKPGDVIKTYVNNQLESIRTVQEGDMIATNVTGEQYVISAKTFAQKYRKDPNHPDMYLPTDKPQLFIQTDKGVKFDTTWGEQMNANPGSFINITRLSENKCVAVDPQVFSQTYARCTKEGELLPSVSPEKLVNFMRNNGR